MNLILKQIFAANLIVLICMPFIGISQNSTKPFYLKSDIVLIANHDKKAFIDPDPINNIYIGQYIATNIAIGITTNNILSTTDDDRYIPIYNLANHQFFAIYFYDVKITTKAQPYFTLKRPFKFKEETYQTYNTDGALTEEKHSFDFFNKMTIGAGISYKLTNNLFFDITYCQLLQKNIYGFKDGITSFGFHFNINKSNSKIK